MKILFLLNTVGEGSGPLQRAHSIGGFVSKHIRMKYEFKLAD